MKAKQLENKYIDRPVIYKGTYRKITARGFVFTYNGIEWVRSIGLNIKAITHAIDKDIANLNLRQYGK